MTSLRSKWQNFFKLETFWISNKSSQKFSVKQKSLVSSLHFCNPLRSHLPHLNMSNDFCKKNSYKRVQKFLFPQKQCLQAPFFYISLQTVKTKWRCRILPFIPQVQFSHFERRQTPRNGSLYRVLPKPGQTLTCG